MKPPIPPLRPFLARLGAWWYLDPSCSSAGGDRGAHMGIAKAEDDPPALLSFRLKTLAR